ncbi:MAG TPA: hypothetical protein VF773_06280 [Verrucomicrobiae bacterium]
MFLLQQEPNVGFLLTAQKKQSVVNVVRFTTLSWLLALLISSARADSWRPPSPRSYLSEDGSKQVHFNPEHGTAELVVSSILGTSTNKLWSVRTPNVPHEIHVSDNGSNVVTTDSWASLGYGDFVVAIYSKAGLVTNYSLEKFAPLSRRSPRDAQLVPYEEKFTHSTSSRWWTKNSFQFFHPALHPTNFCIWLPWRESWTAFDLRTGSISHLEKPGIDALNSSALVLVNNDLSKTNSSGMFSNPAIRALKFLAWLRRPEHLPHLQTALRSRTFRAGMGAISSDGSSTAKPAFFGMSEIRATADQLLANWNGIQSDSKSATKAIHLGEVEGTVVFAKPVGLKGSLHLYLLPEDQKLEPLKPEMLEHSFSEFFEKPYEQADRGRRIHFDLTSIAPGDYRIKIVHDVAPPFASRSDPVCETSAGDYISNDAQIITVSAGKRTTGILINCRTKIGQ